MAWHLKGWNWRSLRGRGCGQTSATVCLPNRSLVSDFLTFLYLISTILKPENWCQWTRDVCGVYFHATALRSHRDWVQKSQACAFEESGSGEINPCDPAVLGEIWLECGAEVLQRAVQAGTGSAPARLSLGPTDDKIPLVKECWEWCKKCVYNSRRSRT